MIHKLSLISILLCSNAYSQELMHRVNDYIEPYVNTGDFSGCILIVKGDTMLYEHCFGDADYTFHVPNHAGTRFKIGSISKQFTAAAILLLEEEGLLSTDDRLISYFPDAEIDTDISLIQLLTHTSGLKDLFSIPGFNTLSCQHLSILELSHMILEEELEFEPGSAYQYSNGGYAVLAQIIEQVSGRSYQDYLDEHIFKPLGMLSTGHNEDNEIVTDLATGYDPVGYSCRVITNFLSNELLKGSGSLYSTPRDLLKWINSIKDREVLSGDLYDRLLMNYGNNYGLGISVYRSFDNTVFGHDGRINGFIADYLHYVEEDLTVIVMGNTQTGVADFLRRDLAAIVLGKEYKSRAKSIMALEGFQMDDQLIGKYAFGPNFHVFVEVSENRIMVRANQGGFSELIPLSDGRYFNRVLYAYIDFVKEDDGASIKMIWENNDGNRFEGIKQ